MITDAPACCQSAAAAMLASRACMAVLPRTHPDKSKQCGSVDVVPGEGAGCQERELGLEQDT